MLAVAHIVGAVIAVFAFGMGVALLGVWDLTRNQKAALEEMSIALNIPVERLDDSENSERIVQFAAARFSSDRFQNRLSDLCWSIQAAWGWLASLLQIGILIAVIWYSVTDSPSNAVYAWSVLAIGVAFWLVSLVFGFLCKFLTGRFPGQARQARKSLAEFVRNNPQGDAR
jgi:hypothetical protein